MVTGTTPKFIILDRNPAENFDVLMDTDSHIVFAVNDGELVRNNLFEDFEAITESDEKARRGWLAYTPPPMALPSNYGDASKWNQWATKNTTGIFLGALVLDRMHWPSQDDASEQQVGDLSDFEGGDIRGLRFGVVGTLNYFKRPWVYTIFGATHAFDKGFERAEWLLIPFFAGSNIVAALSGVKGTPIPRMLVLLAIGIAGRLALMWWLARTFEEQLVDFLEFLQRYQWWAVGISIALVVLINGRNFRRA
jgi:hypothetical protein